MSRAQASRSRNAQLKAAVVKVLGAAGLSFSLANSTSASTMPTFGVPKSDNTSPNPRFVLSEEEMHDVSLATFYVFDRENVGSGMQLGLRMRLRRVLRLRRMRRLSVVAAGAVVRWHCRGCRGWRRLWRWLWRSGCFRMDVGCVGCAVGGACCASWGACRLC